MNLRSAARKCAYHSGAMNLFHRARHNQCLTVLMFHRVQPDAECKLRGADPQYSVTPELLEEIIAFLRCNYEFVGVRDVLQSLSGKQALPPRPVLITFDDGWRDNLEWARQVLQNVPWVLFVATDAVAGPDQWWQEVLLWALRSGRAGYRELWQSATADGSDSADAGQAILPLLMRYAKLGPEQRRRALHAHEEALRCVCAARHMLTAAELRTLLGSGVDVGSHGASHLPLAFVDDVVADLDRSKQWLSDFSCLPVMSFPHGRYNDDCLRAATDLGFQAMFTSDAVLNPCPNGWLQHNVLGRISFNPAAVSDRSGRLLSDKLAAQLYLRDVDIPAPNWHVAA